MCISIVFVLVQKCIVYQQIVGICYEILTFYCCTKYFLYQEHASSFVVVHKGIDINVFRLMSLHIIL